MEILDFVIGFSIFVVVAIIMIYATCVCVGEVFNKECNKTTRFACGMSALFFMGMFLKFGLIVFGVV